MSRFYKNVLPKEEDCVIVSIDKVDEIGIYAKLIEYNGITGFLSFDDVSRTKVASKIKYRPGQQHIMQISSVINNITDIVDLSTKFLTTEQKEETRNRYEKARQVHSIIEYLTIHFPSDPQPPEYFNEQLVWCIDADLYNNMKKLSFTGDWKSIYPEKPNVSDNILSKFIEQVQQRFAPKHYKIYSEFELTCFDESGIDGIKSILKNAVNMSCLPIKVALKAAPTYILSFDTKENKSSFKENIVPEIEILNEFDSFLKNIENESKNFDSSFNITTPPKIL